MYHNLGIIIHSPFPGDPEPSYPPIILENAEPYDIEDTATIGNQILSIMINRNNSFKKSSPNSPVVPHNLKLMYMETINDVISQL